MRPTWRNAVGMAALVIGLTVYALIVMVVGSSLVPEQALIQFLFFAAAGLIWLWPARWLLRWMARGDAAS